MSYVQSYMIIMILKCEKSLVCIMFSRWALEFCGRGICENRASTVKVAAFYCVQN